MSHLRIRSLLFAGLLSTGFVASCGEDDPTPVDTASAPTLASATTTDALVGSEFALSVTLNNPDAMTVAWTVTSPTLAVDAATLVGDDNGATLTWGAAPDEAGTHTVTFEAAFDGGTVSADATVNIGMPEERCIYPSDTGYARDSVFPDHAWTAQYADGTEFLFDLYEFHCDDEKWGDYETLLVLGTADWCPNCPAYIGWIDALKDRLEEEGMLVMLLDLQDSAGNPAYTENSNPSMSQHAPNGVGIRAGDADNTSPNAVLLSGLIEYFPTAFVIRRDDMMLIADQRDTGYYLPLVEIAMEPTADWSAPPQPTITPDFETSCLDDTEEIYEPNNRVEDASTVTPGEAIEGGICDFQGDFYYIDIEGDWRVDLQFLVADGDLDVYVWDVERQRPARGDGPSAIGSATTGDNEMFEHAGAAYIHISGFRNATAPYTLTVTAL